MTTVGPNMCTLGANSGAGTAWTTPTNIYTDDANYATVALGVGAETVVANLYLCGVLMGVGKTLTSDLSVTEAYITGGGSTDMWSVGSLDTGTVISDDFAIGIIAAATNSSQILMASKFAFGALAEGYLDGIYVEVKAKRVSKSAYVNCVRVTIYYTAGGKRHQCSAMAGSMMF